jgi:hypothetical protein
MSDKKKKPAAAQTVAGKTNSGKNNPNKTKKEQEKKRAEVAKQAQRVQEERLKAERERAKKSEDIRKRREKQKAKDEKAEKKQKNQLRRLDERKRQLGIAKKIWGKVEYYTSKEFLGSFNYTRILLFAVLPIVLIAVGISFVIQATFLNVPADILSYEYNGRLESSFTAKKSVFNRQQQDVFIEALDAHGSNKFEFYINSVIPVDDDSSTEELCFGNPEGNDCILVATIFDSDGDILYRSLGLESGKEVNDATLFKELPYGTHKVKVAVNAYDKETNKKIGTKYAHIKLSVGVDKNG